ncbi:MAG: DUF4838 domain-containing protein [Clostridia bacterium]|nr:DUF4838 domain-containing protein [Clostridia bacterium]
MKKSLTWLLLTALLFPTLAACSGNIPTSTDAPTDTPSDKPTEEPTEKPTEEPKETKPADFDDKGNITLGGWSDYVIVRGANSSSSEKAAAYQLQAYIKKLSGATLKVVTDNVAPIDKEIIVGKTNREDEGEFDRAELGTDGFIIKTREKKLFIVGGEVRGTLYGVYTYLEEYLGCRFYTAKFEKLPEYDALPFIEIEEDKQIPVFDVRNSGWADFYNHSLSAKLKLNCSHGRGRIAEDLGGSAYFAGSNCHTLYSLAELTHSNKNKEPCLTSEETYNTVLKNVRRLLDANPGAKYVSVSQNDGSVRDACYCDNCTALREQLGGWSDHYLNFVNKIANAIKDDYPDVMVHTFAYKFTKDAPKTVVPADNVMVQFCTIEACFRHSLTECSAHGADFEKLLSEWSAICNYISVWDYTTDFYYYSVSFPNFDAIYDNMRLFADNNVKKVYEQGNWQTTSGEFAELRGYLISRLLWDPYMSREEYYAYMDEFLYDYYGEGGAKIREYIDYMQKVTEDTHVGIYDSPSKIYPNKVVTVREGGIPSGFSEDKLRKYKEIDWTPYLEWYTKLEPNDILAKGKKLFDEARAMTSDPDQLARLDKAYIQIEFMESYYRHAKLSEIRKNLSKLIPALLTEHMGVDPEGAAAVSTTMVNNILRPLENEYKDYNEQLFDKFFKYGINFAGEARRLELDKKKSYNFANTPDSWGPNTWGT